MQRVKFPFLVILLLPVTLLFNPGIAFAEKPLSQGPVRVEGRKLMVNFDQDGNYTSFKIKGVGYSPFPVGTFSSEWGICEYCDTQIGCLYPDAEHPEISCLGPDYVFDRADVDLDRDLENLVDMYINTIRVWGMVTQKLLDAAQAHGLKVAAGFGVDSNADINPTSPVNKRATIRQQFRNYVSSFKNHPALLVWVIGNENNLYVSNKADWYSLVNEMAQDAYQIEGIYYHPVATVDAGITDIGLSINGSTDTQMSYLDIWGANVYRGQSFGNLFTDFSSRSQKPLWISEYGIDAFNNNTGQEYPATQAQWDLGLVDELFIQGDVCVGSSLMEYSDEWWKYDVSVLQNPWTPGVRIQDRGGFYLPGAAPDNFLNEEYWGIMKIQDNGKLPDIMTPRQIYFDLQAKFQALSTPSFNLIGNRTIVLGSLVNIEINATDTDGDTLTISCFGLPDFLIFTDHGNGLAHISGKANSQGIWPVTITVSDGELTVSETFSLQVRTNAEPVLNTIGNKTVYLGYLGHDYLFFTINASDADADPLTYAIRGFLPWGATFNPQTRRFYWRPTSRQIGTHYVTFTVTDSLGASDSETISIRVLDFRPIDQWEKVPLDAVTPDAAMQ